MSSKVAELAVNNRNSTINVAGGNQHQIVEKENVSQAKLEAQGMGGIGSST